MYTANYSFKKGIKRKGNEKDTSRSSELVAKFRFREEVPPIEIGIVNKRISDIEEINSQYPTSLMGYLSLIPGIICQEGVSTKAYKRFNGDHMTIKVYDPFFARAPCFDMVINSNGLQLEQMLDLDELDHFVLTGKIKQNNP